MAHRKMGLFFLSNETIVENRIQDYIATQKKWGYISKLANKWEISHTQVRRFLKQNGLY
jgi:response regulator of citrate/malate metabolism